MIRRMALKFPIGSDSDMQVIKAFRVQNPDTRELAIHAVYIIDSDGDIFYRKVGLRRPLSRELIDAIDAHRGDYPRKDEVVEPRSRITVAYPQNDFQALLTATTIESLPETIDKDTLDAVIALIRDRRMDDALVAFRTLVRESEDASAQDLLDGAAWLTRSLFFADHPDALETGRLLAWRLGRIAELKQASSDSAGQNEQDVLNEKLARARAGLVVTRAEIERQSGAWNLGRAKTTLRSYREVALAEQRARGSGRATGT